MKSQLTGKNSDGGKDGRQMENMSAEDERVIQHPKLNEHNFEQTL